LLFVYQKEPLLKLILVILFEKDEKNVDRSGFDLSLDSNYEYDSEKLEFVIKNENEPLDAVAEKE